MIVMKFGGTSVENAAAIGQAAGIVRARLARRPLVVVSAMGNTTNRDDFDLRVKGITGSADRGWQGANAPKVKSAH